MHCIIILLLCLLVFVCFDSVTTKTSAIKHAVITIYNNRQLFSWKRILLFTSMIIIIYTLNAKIGKITVFNSCFKLLSTYSTTKHTHTILIKEEESTQA